MLGIPSSQIKSAFVWSPGWMKARHMNPNKSLRNNSRTTIVTRSAIFSFRNGLIMAKMPLKILGSFMMLTALILIGNPSCESEERQNRHRWSSSNVSLRSLVCLCKYSAVTTKHNEPCSGAAWGFLPHVCRRSYSYLVLYLYKIKPRSD